MKLSIIIPVFNEEKTIGQVLDKLISLKLPRQPAGRPVQKEIVVVDDGSTDNTTPQISKFKSQNQSLNLKIIHHKTNQGKGAAIRTGIKHARGDYILIQDADLEYNSEEIPKLLAPILSKPKTNGQRPTANIAVYGSRFLNNQAVIPIIYLWGNKFLTFMTNLLYHSKLTDMETGYKLLPSKFLQKITLKGNSFDIEPEITIKLIKNHISIIEVPISYKGRSRLAGKKLTVKDAYSALVVLLRNLHD